MAVLIAIAAVLAVLTGAACRDVGKNAAASALVPEPTPRTPAALLTVARLNPVPAPRRNRWHFASFLAMNLTLQCTNTTMRDAGVAFWPRWAAATVLSLAVYGFVHAVRWLMNRART